MSKSDGLNDILPESSPIMSSPAKTTYSSSNNEPEGVEVDETSLTSESKDDVAGSSSLTILLASTRQQKLTLLTLFVVELTVVMCVSIMAPFFPKEVSK